MGWRTVAGLDSICERQPSRIRKSRNVSVARKGQKSSAGKSRSQSI